ncbi:MAG: helix-turn-helix domain-containing protein [Planctomycetota bacterium]|jgi:transcriptional regulator with XRE-family HTH domain
MKSRLTPPVIRAATGKVIRELRAGKRVTQEALAEQLGVQYQQIQKYESGIANMTQYRILHLCLAFEISSIEFAKRVDVELVKAVGVCPGYVSPNVKGVALPVLDTAKLKGADNPIDRTLEKNSKKKP